MYTHTYINTFLHPFMHTHMHACIHIIFQCPPVLKILVSGMSQVASPDCAYLFDLVAMDMGALEVVQMRLKPLLEDGKKIKILHDCRQVNIRARAVNRQP